MTTWLGVAYLMDQAMHPVAEPADLPAALREIAWRITGLGDTAGKVYETYFPETCVAKTAAGASLYIMPVQRGCFELEGVLDMVPESMMIRFGAAEVHGLLRAAADRPGQAVFRVRHPSGASDALIIHC